MEPTLQSLKILASVQLSLKEPEFDLLIDPKQKYNSTKEMNA
jgi:hypothetical protein